jgi:hypothetical protein
MSTSSAIRTELVEALKLDLVGPDNDHAFAHELLPDAPSRWYLSGFLVPTEAPADQKTDETSTEEIDSGGDTGGTDDDTEPDRAAARKSILPSSMGLSVLVAPGVETLNATVAWGDYIYEGTDQEPAVSAPTLESPAELHDKPAPFGASQDPNNPTIQQSNTPSLLTPPLHHSSLRKATAATRGKRPSPSLSPHPEESRTNFPCPTAAASR